MRKFDYSELKSKTWDNEILSLIAQIREYKGRQSLYLEQRPTELNRLVEIAKIQSTEASNKIEGIVTTSSRMKELYQNNTAPKNRDEEEIMGYRDILNTIHENYEYISISSNYILQLHRDLYKYSEKSIGGRYKNTQNVISETLLDGTKKIRFTLLAPYETPSAINMICDSFNKVVDASIVDSLLLIPIFINDFLCIHPFNDGNGRMSRLLTTLLLYKQGYFIGKYISLENKIEKTKETYYDALEISNKNWYEGSNDATKFIKYILRIILSAYRDFENRINLVGEKLPAIELVRKAVLNKIGKFTKNEILELTPTISRASVENSLKKLTEEKIIEKIGKGKSTFYVRKI